MKHKLIFRGTYPPISALEVSNFERAFNILLPNIYRNFLMHTNGGHPDKHLFKGVYIEGLYAITDANEYASLKVDVEKMKNELPPQIIPIGYTAGRDRVCVSLVDDRIYLWEHEREYNTVPPDISELIYLEEDIDKLLNNLEGDDIQKSDDILTQIIRSGDVRALDEYLSSGHDINILSAEGVSILVNAVYAGNLDFLKACEKRGAVLKNSGLLHAACFAIEPEIAEYLLECGLDPNEPDKDGRTPLDYILLPGESRVANLLKARGGIFSENK